MRKKSKTLRLADELKNWSGPETGGLITACEVELRRLHAETKNESDSSET